MDIKDFWVTNMKRFEQRVWNIFEELAWNISE